MFHVRAEIVERHEAVAGSQDLEILVIKVGSETLVVEYETFIGISVEGPEHAVVDFINVVEGKRI
jgi:hypothetical protein